MEIQQLYQILVSLIQTLEKWKLDMEAPLVTDPTLDRLILLPTIHFKNFKQLKNFKNYVWNVMLTFQLPSSNGEALDCFNVSGGSS